MDDAVIFADAVGGQPAIDTIIDVALHQSRRQLFQFDPGKGLVLTDVVFYDLAVLGKGIGPEFGGHPIIQPVP